MGRKTRDEEPGAVYHVASRGNDKRTIFADATDRRVFLTMLGRIALKHRWLVYAHCLMTNHFHLVLQIPFGGLSAGMCELVGGFSRCSNARHGRSDHLFRNRFYLGSRRRRAPTAGVPLRRVEPRRSWTRRPPRSMAVEQLLRERRVELAPRFLAVDALLQLFGPDRRKAVAAYRAFVSDRLVAVPGTVTEA